jgi:transposase-like protein
MVERQGKMVAKVVKSTSSENLTPELIKHIKTGATLYTDEWLGYNNIDDLYDHLFVKHNAGEYVKDDIYTNTVEGFWSLLKRGVVGIYHFVSKKHLQKYIDEFVFRYNTRTMATQALRFEYLLNNTEDKYLPYKQLIKK